MGTGAYQLTHFLGLVFAVTFAVAVAPKYNLNRIKTGLFTFIYILVNNLLMRLLSLAITGEWGGQSTIRILVFAPVVTFLLAKIFKFDFINILDATAPCLCIAQALGKIGCMFTGCCYSWLKVDWGVYNWRVGEVLFPLPLLESFVALLIFAALVLYAYKKKFDTCGKLYPIMLVLFCTTRFFLEFLRDNTKIFLNLSELSLWAAFGAVAGVVWLIVKRRKI